MATQGPWLRVVSASLTKAMSKSIELGFLTSQLSGVRISYGYSDVINRIALPLFNPSSLDESVLLLGRKQTEQTKCHSLTTRPRSYNTKKVWWEAGKRFVKLGLSTKALKTIEKNGLDAVAKKAGIDLRNK